MKRYNLEEIMKRVDELVKNKKCWHFHLLSPDCFYNENKGKWCIIVENSEPIYCLSKQKPLKEAEVLSKLMYEEDYLVKDFSKEHEKFVEMPGSMDIERLIQRANSLDKRRVEWHPHHFHPECIFNRHKGRHCIVIEDKTKNEILISVFENKPKKSIQAIERIFYKAIPQR